MVVLSEEDSVKGRNSEKGFPRVKAISYVIFALVAAIIVQFSYSSASSIDVKSVEAAVTFESVSAQVSATLAGFLIVGLLFILKERPIDFKERDWRVWRLDIIALGAAALVLATNALNSVLQIGFALSQDELNSEITKDIQQETFMISLALGLFSVAVGWAYGTYFTGTRDHAGKPD